MNRPWIHDAKVRAWLWQAAVVLALAALLAWLVGNMFDNLARRGIAGGFGFLDRAARFPIAESLLSYRPSDSFGWAFLVGLGNTVFVAGICIVAATALGLAVGLARRSRHPLLRGWATVFVEALRNTPLVVQLLFWYALLTLGLPGTHAAMQLAPHVYLSSRGLAAPAIVLHGTAASGLLAVLAGGAVLAFMTRPNRHGPAGARGRGIWWLGVITGLIVIAWAWHGWGTVSVPVEGRFNFAGGLTLSPEFMALFIGLLLYSSSFIAEVIRGGIDAVERGQWEAGRALGLGEGRILRLIVIPQALRVIVPPLTSQYINVFKNTTLALAVGYPDIALVTATTINQTGQALEGIVVLMLVFLSISIGASVLMNHYNQRISLVGRGGA